MSNSNEKLLYGDTLLNTQSHRLIQVIGKAHLGKTTTSLAVQEMSEGKFVMVSRDRTTLHISTGKVTSSSTGEYLGEDLSRLVHFKGNKGVPHPGLAESLLYCIQILQLKENSFYRVENDQNRTAVNFLAFLNQISA